MSAYDPPVSAVAAAARDLDDREVAELDELLARVPVPFSPLGVVSLDGFLCGVLVQPVRIAPDEWLPYVFDADARRLPTELASDLGVDRATELILRRHRALARALAEHGAFDPLIADMSGDDADAAPEAAGDTEGGVPAVAGHATDTGTAAALDAGMPAADATSPAGTPVEGDPPPAGAAADDGASHPSSAVPEASRPLVEWVAGFRFAADLFPALDELDDDAVHLALARLYRHLPPEDDAQRELAAMLDEAMPLDGVDDAIDDLVAAVADIDDLTRELRFRVDTVRRSVPKIGRNDPCPCGSGKKYKRCHGAGAA